MNKRNSEQVKITNKKYQDLQKKYSIQEKDRKELAEKVSSLEREKKSINDKYIKLTTRVKTDIKQKERIKKSEEEINILQQEIDKLRINLTLSESRNIQLIKDTEAKEEIINIQIEDLRAIKEEKRVNIEGKKQSEAIRSELFTQISEYEQEIKVLKYENIQMTNKLVEFSDYEELKKVNRGLKGIIEGLKSRIDELLIKNHDVVEKLEIKIEENELRLQQIVMQSKQIGELKLELKSQTQDNMNDYPLSLQKSPISVTAKKALVSLQELLMGDMGIISQYEAPSSPSSRGYHKELVYNYNIYIYIGCRFKFYFSASEYEDIRTTVQPIKIRRFRRMCSREIRDTDK